VQRFEILQFKYFFSFVPPDSLHNLLRLLKWFTWSTIDYSVACFIVNFRLLVWNTFANNWVCWSL